LQAGLEFSCLDIKKTVARTFAGTYLALLIFAAGTMFVWMFKLPVIEYHDFAKYYCAAQIVASGEGRKFYDMDFEMEKWRQLSNESVSKRPVCLEISPVWASIIIPFGMVPFKTAYIMWQCSWIAAGVAGLFSLVRAINSRLSMRESVFATIVLVAAVMSSLPEARGMVLGQPCLLILGIISSFCAAFIAKRDITAGIILAVSTVKFQYSPFLGIAALAARRWKLIGAAAAGFAILIALAAAIIGIDSVIQYPSILLKWETAKELEIDINPQSMVNFRGIISIFASPEIAMKCSFPIMLAGLLLTFKIWFDALKIGSKATPWALSFSILCMLLCSAHVHMYECIVLSVCAALTLPSFDLIALSKLKPLSMKLWAWILVIYPVLMWIVFFADVNLFHFKFGSFNFSVLTVITFNLINLILAVLAAVNMYRQPKGEDTAVASDPAH
jgi:hypothetical protein